MYCRNCGELIKGDFCSKCGIAVQENATPTTVPFSVFRKKNFYGVAQTVRITVDNSQAVKLESGQTVTYYLTPGQHIVTIKSFLAFKRQVVLNITDVNKNYLLVVKPDFWLGGFKADKKESILQ